MIMKQILSGFRISEESKQMLRVIKDDYGVKSLSAIIDELLYYVSHGVMMPESSFDVPAFIQDVLAQKYVDKESFRKNALIATVYDRYIESLEESGIGNFLFEKCVDMSMREALSKYPEHRINIQGYILEHFSDPLSKHDVLTFCNYWYEKSVESGKMSELTKQQILKEVREKERRSQQREAEEARQRREHINYYTEVSE